MKHIITIFFLSLISFNLYALEDYIDEREGANNQVYSVRQLGDLLWQESNASFPARGSVCHSDEAECPEIGRLYSWPQAQKACDNEKGWRVAMDNDWMDLEKVLGMQANQILREGYMGNRGNDEGDQLKEDGEFGFDQPAGFKSGGRYLGINDGDSRSYFWSVSVDRLGRETYFRRNIRANTKYIHRFRNGLGSFSVSVRCVKEI
jgi:uncharacterized protein (TIGR02145 family)